MLLVESRDTMKAMGWTAFSFLLLLALPLSRLIAGQQASDNGKGVIVLLGHSHVANWGVKSLAGFPVINRGRGGDRTQDLIARFERDVVPNRPRAVVIWAFDNDIMDAPNHDIAAATERAEANLLKLIELARAHSIEPILTTEVTIIIRPTGFSDQVASAFNSLFGMSPYEDRINGRIVEGNRWLREQVQRRHLLLLDFQRALADSSDRRRPQYAQPDGVHLTKEAYDVITAQAEAILSASLRR
jgi:lysophospholipase L1-like esterase